MAARELTSERSSETLEHSWRAERDYQYTITRAWNQPAWDFVNKVPCEGIAETECVSQFFFEFCKFTLVGLHYSSFRPAGPPAQNFRTDPISGFELSLYFHMGFDVEISLFHHFIISSLRFRNFILIFHHFIIASRLNFHISSWKFHHFIISSFCNLLISSWKFHHFIISSFGNLLISSWKFHHFIIRHP